MHLVCSAAALHHIPPQTTQPLSEPSTTTVPRSRHSANRGTLSASKFIKSPRGSIPHQRQRTPSPTLLASVEPGRHQSPAPTIAQNNPPKHRGAPRFNAEHQIANPTNKHEQTQLASCKPGRHNPPPHPITSKNSPNLTEHHELPEARQTASPTNQHGQPPKPLTP